MSRMTWLLLSSIVLSIVLSSTAVHAAEICGNSLDDDSDGKTDEDCYPSMRSGVCASPLSCMDTGWVSWTTGSLHYDLPADVAPASPFGPLIGLRRFYTSMYAPSAPSGFPAPVNRTPLGPRWQHNYMSWIDRPSDPAVRILHTPQGEDVRATFTGSDEFGMYNYFQVQQGHHYRSFVQQVGGEAKYWLTTLTGDTLVYNSAGLLVEVWDRLASPNRVFITWTSTPTNKVVDTVTDATGVRRLRFKYTGGMLSSVEYQLKDKSPADPDPWTTHHTTSYLYASGALSTVTIGQQLAQVNTYSGGYLVQIRDGDNRQLATFRYAASTPGRIVAIDTRDGTVGFEYAATRNTCKTAPSELDKTRTILFFNKGNTTSCQVDADCGSGLLCGGTTGIGATGTCFRAAQCLTVDTTNALVTDITALGPPGECTGACASVTRYVWNTALDLQAVRDAGGTHVSAKYNADGLPTKIVYGDPDEDPTNANGARRMFLLYDSRGRLVEVRAPSVMAFNNGSACTETNAGDCARTLYEYDPSTGNVSREIRRGLTLGGTEGPAEFEHTTTWTYDARGRLTSTDGPVPGTDDVTQYTYADSSLDPKWYGFLSVTTETGPMLQRRVHGYSVWGEAIQWEEPDGTHSCRTYSTARNVLVKTTEKMAGGTCTSPDDPSDLVEEYAWDTSLRLTRKKNADGSCVHYEYDAKGRLANSKRRDDCNLASPGPREQYVYDVEGLLTGIDTYDAAGVVTRKHLATYYDSRQVQALVNPVDTTKVTALTYDARGVATGVAHAGNLGTTTLTVDGDYQVTKVDRSRSSTVVDSWVLLRDLMTNLKQVTDPDGKRITTTYDDQGLVVERGLPDVSQRLRLRYDENGNPIGHSFEGDSTSYTRDGLGRVKTADFPGSCSPSAPPELEVIYDQHTCPVQNGCANVRGRVAAVRATLMCGVDQWTHYSYDAAGRVVAEYIRDNAGRVANQYFTWTKAGGLASIVTPSTATIGWTYGSAASNADTNRVTAISRASTPIIDDITWKPDGPVEQYDRYDTISGSPLRMKHSYDLAYRPTRVRLDAQNGTGPYYQLAVSTDAKGRVTMRDVYPSHSQMPGVYDSYFLYDDADRLLCESKVAATTCPTTADQLKNHVVGGLTGAGNRGTLLRPHAHGGITNTFTRDAGRHRIASIAHDGRTTQGGTIQLGPTNYAYDTKGRRTRDDTPSLQFDERVITYDVRNNVASVSGYYAVGAGNWHPYTMRNAFDALNRRVFKAFEDTHTGVQEHWYFYYDPRGRLTEVRHVPHTAMPQYTVYQLVWLDHLLVAYWQTDMPSGTTSKRYVEYDETGRPVRMHAWAAGNSQLAWAVDQDAWGFDKVVIGADLFQPIVFAGQYRDEETASYLADGVTMFRPGLVHNGHRTYDPFTGTYLQIDPRVTTTWDEYSYANNNPVGLVDPQGLQADDGTYTGTPEDIYIVDPWHHLTESTFDFEAGLCGPESGPMGDGGDGGPEPDQPAPPAPPPPPVGTFDPRLCGNMDEALGEYNQAEAAMNAPGNLLNTAGNLVTAAAATVLAVASCPTTPVTAPATGGASAWVCKASIAAAVGETMQLISSTNGLDVSLRYFNAHENLKENLTAHRKCMFGQ